MPERFWYAILPYLKTSGRVRIRGIEIRSHDDLEDVPPEARRDLADLLNVFFMRDDFRIELPSFAFVPAPATVETHRALINRLHQARLLIAYLYTAPHS